MPSQEYAILAPIVVLNIWHFMLEVWEHYKKLKDSCPGQVSFWALLQDSLFFEDAEDQIGRLLCTEHANVLWLSQRFHMILSWLYRYIRMADPFSIQL